MPDNVPATRNPNALPAPAKLERLRAKVRDIRSRFASTYAGERGLVEMDEVLRDLELLKPHLDALLTPATKGDVLRFVARLVDYWQHSKGSETYLEATCEDVGGKQPLLASLDETFRRLRRDPEQRFIPNSGQILEVLADAERDIRVTADTYDRAVSQRAKIVQEIEEVKADAERQRLADERKRLEDEAYRKHLAEGGDDIPF
jgi:hypothetical protein